MLRLFYIFSTTTGILCAQVDGDELSFNQYIGILLNKGISIEEIKANGVNITDEMLQKIYER